MFTDAAEKELSAADRIGRLGGDEFATVSVIGLLREADRLMYAAKHTGKNAARVSIAAASPTSEKSGEFLPQKSDAKAGDLATDFCDKISHGVFT